MKFIIGEIEKTVFLVILQPDCPAVWYHLIMLHNFIDNILVCCKYNSLSIFTIGYNF